MLKILFLSILLLLLSCNTSRFINTLENGDLVFVEANKKNLSGAISRVTKKNDSISFDHVGLVEIYKKRKYLLHSFPSNGSEKILLKNFVKVNHSKGRKLVGYRLKNDYKDCIERAIKKANSLLGKPYNSLFILSDNEYYCSDFIERAYRDCQIFELKPMTFINPETGKTDEFWINFYQSKNTQVPEGKLGCNPNGISNSKKIHKIATLK